MSRAAAPDQWSASAAIPLAARFVGVAMFAVTLALIITTSTHALVITDDFSDGTDGSAGTAVNPTPSPTNVTGPVWSRLDGLAGSFGGATWDASTGQYRLTAPNNGFAGYGIAGAFVPTSFTDVKVSADFVSFGGPGVNPAFGVLARSNGLNGLYIGSTGLNGYGWVYEPYTAGGLGEMTMFRFDQGANPFVDIGSVQVSLNPAKDYTFTLTIVGNQLHGQVFEIGGGMVAERLTTDSTYASGYSGILSLSRDDGDPSNGVEPTVDFTIDNFRTEDAPVGVPGDYNGNGKVDGADYVLWRHGGPLQNEVDTPGTVNAADYTEWRARFGNPPGSGSGLSGGAVPEPATTTLILLISAATAAFGGKRRARCGEGC